MVADFHTYFVGCDEWGFSVWAHNAECAILTRTDRGEYILSKTKPDGTMEILRRGTETDVLQWVQDGGQYRISELRGITTPKTNLTPDMEAKILNGALKDPAKNDMVGGHSPRILNDNTYIVEIVSENADGTISVKWAKEIPGRPGKNNLSNTKPSTLAPKNWTDSQISSAVKEVADLPPYEYDLRGSTHVGTVYGVEWQVIKDRAGNITSAFPTGGKPPLKLTGQ